MTAKTRTMGYHVVNRPLHHDDHLIHSQPTQQQSAANGATQTTKSTAAQAANEKIASPLQTRPTLELLVVNEPEVVQAVQQSPSTVSEETSEFYSSDEEDDDLTPIISNFQQLSATISSSSSLSIFRSRSLLDEDEDDMLVLKRANPILDSDDEEGGLRFSPLDSPSKRLRRSELDVREDVAAASRERMGEEFLWTQDRMVETSQEGFELVAWLDSQ